MAVRGRVPDPNATRRNARVTADEPLERVPAPPLPDRFSPEVQAWYATWVRSPQGAYFLETDWQRLAMLAMQVEIYYQGGDRQTLAEIRQNETLLGAAVTDRLRLNMKFEQAPPVKPPARRRNLKVVPPTKP